MRKLGTGDPRGRGGKNGLRTWVVKLANSRQFHGLEPVPGPRPVFPRSPVMNIPAADPWGERLSRRLGLWSAVAVLVGSTIGSGIFRTPASVAQRIDDVPLFLLAWVVGWRWLDEDVVCWPGWWAGWWRSAAP